MDNTYLPPGALPIPNTYFGTGDTPIFTKFVSCVGEETSFFDCFGPNDLASVPADGTFRDYEEYRFIAGVRCDGKLLTLH